MKLLRVLLLLSVCGLLAIATAAAAPRVFSNSGVAFTYDDALLAKPKLRRVKAIQLASPTDIPEDVAPAHLEIHFGKENGVIWIFPTRDPQVANFAKAYPTHAAAQRELQRVLNKRPSSLAELPLLPWADLGLPFHKKIRYANFRNGSGVIFLTQWTIEPTPINNAQLWYVFQGLSRDGAYYISAEMPVRHPSLPPTQQVRNFRSFEKNYPAYVEKAAAELAAQPDSSFQPPLTSLRELFLSIRLPSPQ